MAALSDHDRRDAEHVARCEISIVVQRYVRRTTEKTKVIVKEKLDEAARTGASIDPVALGRAAAAEAIAEYFGIAAPTPYPAIEGRGDPAGGVA